METTTQFPEFNSVFSFSFFPSQFFFLLLVLFCHSVILAVAAEISSSEYKTENIMLLYVCVCVYVCVYVCMHAGILIRWCLCMYIVNRDRRFHSNVEFHMHLYAKSKHTQVLLLVCVCLCMQESDEELNECCLPNTMPCWNSTWRMWNFTNILFDIRTKIYICHSNLMHKYRRH